MSWNDPVVVIGHRGAAGLEPENTLASFRRAYRCGVGAIELDVYLVQGELVVIHDDTLERTTNGVGRLMDVSLDALRRLDAGGGQRVPLLHEVVEELPAGVGLNVELKGPATSEPVADFLRRYPHHDVLVSSFDHGELHRFRQADGGTRVAPLLRRWRGNPWQIAEALDAWAVNLSRWAATPGRLRAARERGYRTFVYTVNELGEARRLVAQGATGVFTDYPDRITAAALAPPGR